MPKYEYKCPEGHITIFSQKYTQGKPPVHLEECGESGCPERPKRYYAPIPFRVY